MNEVHLLCTYIGARNMNVAERERKEKKEK